MEQNEIEKICKKYGVTNYTIHKYGIDVDGDVDLTGKNLTELPPIFYRVSGNFNCSNNSLTTLKGSPSVGGDYNCSHNKLTSLNTCPRYVHGDFICSYNNIRGVHTYPEELGGKFICDNNPIGSIFNNINMDFLRGFNAYGVMRFNQEEVLLKRLKYVMGLYDQPVDLEEIEKHYKIIL